VGLKINQKMKRILLIFILAVLLIIWIAWGNSALMVSSITITGDRVPESFSGFRIAHISDLHNTEFGEENEKLLQKISGANPDIIAITGDLIDSNHTDLTIALDFVKNALKIAPVYYVTGNHEANIQQYGTLLEGLHLAGINVVDNKRIQLERNGEQIALIGLPDPNFMVQEESSEDRIDIVKQQLEQLINDNSCYTILLSHRPELFDLYVSCKVDLVLSGHAHGGQFRIPLIGGLIAPNQGFFPKYDAGLYTEGDTNMAVSRGLGNSIIPFRIYNRPEIILIQLGR